MTEAELSAIEHRHRLTTRTVTEDDTHNALCASADDVPMLVDEVRRLRGIHEGQATIIRGQHGKIAELRAYQESRADTLRQAASWVRARPDWSSGKLAELIEEEI